VSVIDNCLCGWLNLLMLRMFVCIVGFIDLRNVVLLCVLMLFRVELRLMKLLLGFSMRSGRLVLISSCCFFGYVVVVFV